MNSTSLRSSREEESSDVFMPQRILDSVPVAIMVFDKDRRVLYNNKTAAMLPGFVPVGSFIDEGQDDVAEDNEYYDFNGNLLVYPRALVVDRVFQGQETHDLLLEYRNKKYHKECWISFSAMPVMDENGNFDCGILCYRDVSDQKSCDNKLEFLLKSSKIFSITMELEKRLEELARLTVPLLADWCCIYLAQDDNSIRRVVSIHRDPKKSEQLKAYEKIHRLSPAMRRVFERIMQTGKPELASGESSEVMDGTFSGIEATSVMFIPISSGGKVSGVTMLAYAGSGRTYSYKDLSFSYEFTSHWKVIFENSRLYHEISQRDLSKDAFLAYLSHELRNPLAPIKSALELLCIKNKDREIVNDLQMISHQFNLIVRLLGDLLDKTRLTSGKIKLDMKMTDLNRLVQCLVSATRPIADNAKITLHVSLPEEPAVLFVDPARIEQALSNLLHNAVKFTPPGGSIFVDLSQTDKDIILKVKDTGAGISAGDIEHIFELYYQSERTQHGNRGLGLGLLLANDIIKLHGGSIEAKSEGADKGSEFIVTLPVIKSTITPPLFAEDIPPVMENCKKKILVVDDNQVAADSLVRLLVALDWKDASALYAAQDVLPYLKEHKVDTIFLDVGMPDMNGYELVKLLREQGYVDLPVIALTGYGLPEDKRKALDAGFTAHLTKPIGTRELREVLE